jgi:hypothetical protein
VSSITARVAAVFGVFALILFPVFIRRFGLTEADVVGWALIGTAFLVVIAIPAYLVWRVHQMMQVLAYMMRMMNMPAPRRDGKVVSISAGGRR